MDNKWLWIGIAGVGAYVIWHYMSQPDAKVIAPTGGSVAPTGVSTVVTPAVVTAPTPARQIRDGINSTLIQPAKLVAEAYNEGVAQVTGGPKLTVSQWNYGLNKITGIPGQFLGDDGTPISAGAYVSLLGQWASANGAA